MVAFVVAAFCCAGDDSFLFLWLMAYWMPVEFAGGFGAERSGTPVR
jgi:hypothetical protein